MPEKIVQAGKLNKKFGVEENFRVQKKTILEVWCWNSCQYKKSGVRKIV